MPSSLDGLGILRAWQRDNTSLTIFTLNLPGFTYGRFNSTVLSVGPTGRIVVDLPGSVPPSSSALDLTEAEFTLIEADSIPEDFPILHMGIDGYERFLSAKCADGAFAIFGERTL